MKDYIRYNDYLGTVQYSAEDEVFYGKLEGINDLVTFEGESVSELQAAFRQAVDEYVMICQETGKEPEKAYKGSFNVRINPELHRKVVQKSLELGMSLNQFTELAIRDFLEHHQVNPAG